jgi:transcriptional regulator with XRE-family HTH domain
VSECALIVDVLKRTLKNRGLTYRDLAKKVGLSEASVKRVFAEETFTLQRLEKVCSAIGITMSELVRMATEKAEPAAHYLSMEQEQLLAADPRLLACFYLLLNGRASNEIQARLQLNDRELRALYVKLDAAKLIESLPGLKARLRVGPMIIWRVNGPVRRAHEAKVKAEFLQSDFKAADEVLHFHTAELSEASAQLLFRRLETLTREFAEFATLDRNLPIKQKRPVALLLAFRPWVFSMFDGLTRKS